MEIIQDMQLNENLLSPVYEQFRKTLYEYHLQGLRSEWLDDKKGAKEKYCTSLLLICKNLYNDQTKYFFDKSIYGYKK